MKIFLMQHGKSLPEEVDPEKSLSSEGRIETEKIADILRNIGVKPDKILTSGKKRAIETAEIVSRYLDVGYERVEGLNPLDDPSIIYSKLMDMERDIFIVGHLPHLSRLLSKILGVDREVVKFRYSGVVCLEKEEVWRILWYIRPDIIR